MAYPGVQAGGGQSAADPLYHYFQQVCDASNTMKVSDVRKFLSSISKSDFSSEIAGILLEMLDRDFSNSIGFNEFKELITTIQAWMSSFIKDDRDRTGFIDKNELSTVLRNYGYNLSPQMIDTILYRFDPETRQRLSFANYVGALVILRSITSQFRTRDVAQTGVAKFSYDDFMCVAVQSKP